MTYFPSINSGFNRVSQSFSSLPKWQPSEETLNKFLLTATLASTILSLRYSDNDAYTKYGSGKMEQIHPPASIFNKVVVCIVGIASLTTNDMRCLGVALMINNMAGLVTRNMDPALTLLGTLCVGGFISFLRKTQWLEAPPINPAKPKSSPLIEYLNENLNIQSKARENLTKAIASYQNKIKSIPYFSFSSDAREATVVKHNILLSGPKGCGMLEMIHAISKFTNIPCYTDLKSISGYEGKLARNTPFIFIVNLDDKVASGHLHTLTDFFCKNGLFVFLKSSKTPLMGNDTQFLKLMPAPVRNSIGSMIAFDPFTKEDCQSLLFQVNGKYSFYRLQKDLMQTGRLLNVQTISQEVVNELIERALQSTSPLGTIEHILEKLYFSLMQQHNDDHGASVDLNMQILSKSLYSDLTLTQMKAFLDERVVGQDLAKQAIIEAIFFHQSQDIDSDSKIPKGNTLLIGPSGSGKTYIVEMICRHLNIPMASIDISRATTEGYVGPKISDVFQALVQSAGGDIEKASKGIVFFDEVDKVFEDAANGKNSITGLAIQNQLLCLLQGDKIFLNQHNGWGSSSHPLNTENVLFIFAGAFHKQVTENQGKILGEEDLLKGGVRPEFLGRIGYVSQLNALTREQMKQILTHGPKAVITAWKKQYTKFGFSLSVKEETLDAIVDHAMSKQTGARGLHNEVGVRLSRILAQHIAQKERLGDTSIPEELPLIEV